MYIESERNQYEKNTYYSLLGRNPASQTQWNNIFKVKKKKNTVKPKLYAQ